MMNNTTNNTMDFNVFAEMVAKKMVEMSGAPAPDNSNSEPRFGKYEGKTICGEVYNPYTVRRWISAQFTRLASMTYDFSGVYVYTKYDNINDAIRRHYTYKYSILYTIKECKKLAKMERNDPVAFSERKMFFTEAVIRSVIFDFANAKGYNDIITALHKCKNYKQLTDVCSMVEIVLKGDRCTNLKMSKDFISAFKKSGAYYTLKNYIMFQKDFLLFWDGQWSVEDNALRVLRSHLDDPDYFYYAAFKESLKRNSVDIRQPFAAMNN